jgi:hypothetical protein
MAMSLVVMVPAAFGTPAGGNFNVSVVGTAVDSIPHQIDLKVTELPGGQLSEVSGFAVSPEDVVQVKQGENIVVSTSTDLKTHKVKVTNAQGQLSELLPLSSNIWSLQGLTPGIYKLDVIVDISSSGMMGAYETILVILLPDQQSIENTEVTKIFQRTEIGTKFDDYLFTGWPNAYCEGEGEARVCWESKEIKEQADREIEAEKIWREENELGDEEAEDEDLLNPKFNGPNPDDENAEDEDEDDVAVEEEENGDDEGESSEDDEGGDNNFG